MNTWPPVKLTDIPAGVKVGEILQVATGGLILGWRSTQLMQDWMPGFSSHLLNLKSFDLVDIEVFPHLFGLSLGSDITIVPNHTGFFTDDLRQARDGDLLLGAEPFVFAKFQERTQLVGLQRGTRAAVDGRIKGIVFRSWSLRIGPAERPHVVFDLGAETPGPAHGA